MSGKLKSLKMNATMNLLKVVAGLVFPLITFPYTSRVLGPEGVGKINFATSFVGYFTLLASIGVPLYGIREVAKIRENRQELASLIQELLVMHGVASGISLLLLLTIVILSPKIYAEWLLFFIVSASVPLSVLTMDWLYQGLEEYVYITIRSLTFTFLSVISLFLFVHHPEDYWINAVITVMASLGSSVLNFWNARKLIFSQRSRPWNFRKHLKPLSMIYALNFIISIYINLDTVMLGFMSTAKNVGYYASSMKLTKMLLAMVTSFGGVLLPRLAWYLANDKRYEFDRMLRKSLGIILFLCIPITASLILLGREIILVIAGSQYLEAVSCINITAPIILFIGLTNIFGMQILYPLGRERGVVVSVAFGALVSLILNFALIPTMAHLGAAWATLAAESIVLIVQLFIIRKIYVIQWPWGSLFRILVGTVAMGLTIIFVHSLTDENQFLLRLLIDVPCGSLVYLLALYLMKEEFFRELLDVLKKRLAYGKI